ncbi:MAG: hypothetical protein NTW25_00390 [Candidatus Kapabacteria bacterium]|nr:hypothetical protein [Candidatus Kapabacteria bacterium]
MEKFKNEVVLDFNHFEHERKQKHALNNVRSLFGMEYTNLIGGKEVRTDNKTHSYSPPKKHRRGQALLALLN